MTAFFKRMVKKKIHKSRKIDCIIHNIPCQIALSSARKTLNIEVRAHTAVVVRAPFHYPITLIESFVQKHVVWIQEKQAALQDAHQKKIYAYQNGEQHLFLGQYYTLKIIEHSCAGVVLQEQNLIVNIPTHHTALTAEEILKKWYLEKAKELFPRLLENCFERFSLKEYTLPPLSVRFMKTRWGSLTAKNKVTLNAELIRAPKECIEYVIMHELCHLKHRNHGKRFHALLEKQIQNCKELQKILKNLL